MIVFVFRKRRYGYMCTAVFRQLENVLWLRMPSDNWKT